jgi:DNA-binding transcriptional ArsR family regulator
MNDLCISDRVVHPSITEEHRRQYYLQVLESYRAFVEDHPAGFVGALIAMAAGLGRITERPPDISSLAGMLAMSRTTIVRKVTVLEKAGLVKRKRNGRRVLVLSTYNPETGEGRWPMADELILQGRVRLKE